MRTLSRVVVTAALMVVFSLAGLATAAAHAALIGGDPADGAALPVNPARVTATFNEQMQPAFAAMTVVGPDGGQYSDGDVAVAGANISVGVRQGGPAGAYTVNYRATSADGHVVSGSWSYTVTESAPSPTAAPAPTAEATTAAAPTTTATTAAPPAPADSGIPVWPFIVGASVIVAGGAIWAARRRL